MATTSTNQFDFDAYNAVMKTANSGLRLYLAEQILSDVLVVMTRYKSPLRKDLSDLVDELAQLRADNKKLAAARETSTSGEIDNATLESKQTTSADYGRITQQVGEAPL